MSNNSNKLSIWENLKRFNHIFLIFTIVFWMIGLFLTNYSNAQNLERSELTDKIQKTEDQLRLLNTEMGMLQSTERVETESQRLNLVKVDNANVIYLNSASDHVALK